MQLHANDDRPIAEAARAKREEKAARAAEEKAFLDDLQVSDIDKFERCALGLGAAEKRACLDPTLLQTRCLPLSFSCLTCAAPLKCAFEPWNLTSL